MKLFHNRPLCFACTVALILSAVISRTGFFCAVAAAAASVVAAAVSIPFGTRVRRAVIVAAAACLAVSASFIVRSVSVGRIECGSVTHITAYVSRESEENRRIAVIETQDGRRAGVSAVCFGDLPDTFGEFEADAVLTPYAGADETYMKSKNVYFTAEIKSIKYAMTYKKNAGYYAERVREAACVCLYRVSDDAGILCRIFLGKSDSLPVTFSSDMRSLGLSHLLAVSGLHVTALLAGIDLVIRLVIGRRRPGYVILGAAALCYMAVTGFSGSVTRAAVMYAFCALAPLLGRRPDPVTTLTAVCTGIVTVDFNSVYDAGFILSFFATLGILTLGSSLGAAAQDRLGEKHPILCGVLRSFAVTASALLFTVPPAALYYGRLAYGAILYNAVASPVVGLILYICPLILVFSRVPFAGRALGVVCDGLCGALKSFAHAAAGSVPSVSLRYDFVFPLLIALAAALTAAAFISRRRLVYVSIFVSFVLIFSALAAVFSLTFYNKAVIIVSVGRHGDVLAVCDKGSAVIYDFSQGYSDAFYPLAGELMRRGVTRAEYALCAKPSGRHLQQIVTVTSYFDITKITVPEELSAPLRILIRRQPDTGTVDGLTVDGKNRIFEYKGAVYIGSGDGGGFIEGAAHVIVGSLSGADAEKMPDNAVFPHYGDGKGGVSLTVIGLE